MSARPVILVVDDEPQIQRFLRHALEASGYETRLAGTAAAAARELAAGGVGLAIVDLGLPDLDGKLAIGQLRQHSGVPVIVLSARDDEAEKIAALDLGANDFVAKPFAIGELLARIRACLRTQRAADGAKEKFAVGTLTLDTAAHRVEKDGKPVKLTPKEFELLELLFRNAGRVLTHRQILAKIWGPAHVEDVAYLRVFVRQLRQKIEDAPADPALILTEPGVGYRAVLT